VSYQKKLSDDFFPELLVSSKLQGLILQKASSTNTYYMQTTFYMTYHVGKGLAVAQAVSPWVPTAAAWVRAQIKSCGICGEQSGTGAGFLQALRFPLPIIIPPTVPHSIIYRPGLVQ
jgi:hypothetical protein